MIKLQGQQRSKAIKQHTFLHFTLTCGPARLTILASNRPNCQRPSSLILAQRAFRRLPGFHSRAIYCLTRKTSVNTSGVGKHHAVRISVHGANLHNNKHFFFHAQSSTQPARNGNWHGVCTTQRLGQSYLVDRLALRMGRPPPPFWKVIFDRKGRLLCGNIQ